MDDDNQIGLPESDYLPISLSKSASVPVIRQELETEERSGQGELVRELVIILFRYLNLLYN